MGALSFKPEGYDRKPLIENLFDSSSSEDEEDPKVKLVAGKSIDDGNHDAAQSPAACVDTDSLSYGNEDYRSTSKMGTCKLMKETVLPGGEEVINQ